MRNNIDTAKHIPIIAENLLEYWGLEKKRARSAMENIDWQRVDDHLKTWLRVGESVKLTPALFYPYLQEMFRVFETPDVMMSYARSFLQKEMGRRKNPLSPAELEHMAAYLFGSDFHAWKNGLARDYFKRDYPFSLNSNFSGSSSERIDTFRTKLPTPRFAGHSPALRLTHSWHRGESLQDGYPHQEGKTLSEEIAEMLTKQSVVKVLDIGMGTGFLLDQWKAKFGNRVHTTGVTIEDYEYAYHTGDAVHFGPAEILPQKWTNTFDLVVSYTTFCYLLFPFRGLSEAIRVLKPERNAHLALYNSYGYFGPRDEFVAERVGKTTEEVYEYQMAQYTFLNQDLEKFLGDAAKVSGSSVRVIPGSGCSFQKMR